MKEMALKLNLAEKRWEVSHYLNGESDPEIVRLFGTETIPTPFGVHTDERAVLAVLRDANPGVHIYRV